MNLSKRTSGAKALIDGLLYGTGEPVPFRQESLGFSSGQSSLSVDCGQSGRRAPSFRNRLALAAGKAPFLLIAVNQGGVPLPLGIAWL